MGRVMTCVLGMVVRREREIREFVKTPFYRVLGTFGLHGPCSFEGEWRAVSGSRYFESPHLYKENGFKEKEDAEELIGCLSEIRLCGRAYIHGKEEGKRKIRRFSITWRSSRMTVPKCLRSARMRP